MQSHGESVVCPQVAPVSSSVDKVSVIDASARRRDLFPPQSIQSSISLPKHTELSFQITRRTDLPGFPGWVFLLGTLFPVARQSVATAQSNFAASGEDGSEFLCSTLLAFSRHRLGLLGERVCAADQSGKRESPAEFSAGETAAKLLPSFSGSQWTRGHCVGSEPSCHKGAFQRS